MAISGGKYTYRVVEGWGQGPQGHEFGVIPAVAADSRDHVYLVNRSPQPAILVFDREGRFLRSWGEDIFTEPHGIWIGPDDRVLLTDTRDHTVRLCTTEGKVLHTLGTRNQPSDSGYDGKSTASVKRGAAPFNRPTRAMAGPSGAIYVTDGYGNARVHKFAPDGTLLLSWGEPGPDPGQFNLPHSVWVDGRERLYVLDRENNRLQVFDGEGRFLSQWNDLVRPTELFMDAEGAVYVSEARAGGRVGGVARFVGSGRISVFTPDGELLARWGEHGEAPGQFLDNPHGLWVDSRGDLYVAEVTAPRRLQKFTRV